MMTQYCAVSPVSPVEVVETSGSSTATRRGVESGDTSPQSKEAIPTSELNLKWLADGWRAKGIDLSSRFHGEMGDMILELLRTCAEEVEEEAARLNKEYRLIKVVGESVSK